VRPDPDGVLEADGGSRLPSLADLKSSVVCWAVDSWVARRFEASPANPEWTETECVVLENNEAGTQEEWARRFSQREKQLLVGKGTRGYRRFLRMIPKPMRKPGDPQTPRVAEQCSKRAFDGRLKQWRILLHAFSPRESEDEADGEPEEMLGDTNLMEEIHKALVKESQGGSISIPPTPPKPTALMSPKAMSDSRHSATPLSAKGSRKSPNGHTPSAKLGSPMTPSRQNNLDSAHGTPLPVVPGFPFPGFSYTIPEGTSPMPSPLPSPDHINALTGMAELAPPNLDALLDVPEFQDLLRKMESLPAASINALFASDVAATTNPEMDEGVQDSDFLPTGLLDNQPDLDLDLTLNKAKVPEDLKPIFKEAFANVHQAFTKNTDEREVILANAARAVIGSMPPTEQAPLKVLDTLLAFLNELRSSYAPRSAPA
jgi:hypothetical protein